MKIVKLKTAVKIADEVRGLFKSSGNSALSTTLKDLAGCIKSRSWALCGGLAVGYHSRPRGTDDIDILVPSDHECLAIVGDCSKLFSRVSDHVMSHRKTGVGIDMVTPEWVNVPSEVVLQVLSDVETAIIDGVRIPIVSKTGMVALKLYRATYQDLADIQSLMAGGTLDLGKYSLGARQRQIFEDLTQKE